MATVDKRIGAGSALSRDIDTVPSFTDLTGNVTSNTTDTTVLNYSGTDNWDAIFTRPSQPQALTPNPYATTPNSVSNAASKVWLYVPNGAILVQVLGATITGTNTWALQMAASVPSLTSEACNLVIADLLGYSFVNDGATTGSVNGITINQNERQDVPQLAPSWSRTDFQLPILVVATGTSFLVSETF